MLMKKLTAGIKDVYKEDTEYKMEFYLPCKIA